MNIEDSYFQENSGDNISRKKCSLKTLLVISTGFLGSIYAYAGLYLVFKWFPIHIELPVIHVAFPTT